MRHNQNARRPQRGRGNGGGHNNGGNHHHHNNSGQNGRRLNPRVHSFDSNGPEVRIRGTAYQINEKYVTLARDAASAGDRVLAESYLQHAEHYQRFINEMNEEFNQYNQQNAQHQQQLQGQQPQSQVQQPLMDGAVAASTEVGTLNDLDQGFLVGPRHNGSAQSNGGESAAQPSQEQPREQHRQQRGDGRNHSPRRNESESA
ncbi:MAG: DUF4167 domain-containing protein [Proteobacteria bacterium]|nr:DUF4167 domain-containing protein [Pseudomonadota bacterium]